MFVRLKVASAVNLFGAVVTLGFIAAIGTGLIALDKLKIGGALYDRVVLGKDLVADILPPPAYVIESYLEATLALNEPESASEHAANLARLHKEYDERHTFWQEADLPAQLRQALTVTSHADVARFWTQVETAFLPALKAKDMDTARRAYGELSRSYAAHRATIDKIVEGANAMNLATEADAKSLDKFYLAIVWLVSGLVLLIVLGGVFAIVRGVVRPVIGMTDAMSQLADGRLDIAVPSTGRHDEIGSMAAAVNVFKDNAIEAERLRGEQEKDRARAEQEKNQALQGMADRIEQETQRVVEAIARQSGEMAGHASGMSRSANTVSVNSQSVATAATQAQANVNAVASASEELSASIHEIATQVAASRNATHEAVAASSDAERTISELTAAVAQIGAVTQLITDIAAQTNLLALNATIEAARAGEAGKGFAVVAGEVKSLASQTAKATEEISGQISSIQSVTDEAVRSVKAIASSVRSVEGLATAISAAIEEQSATTSEIARNVGETSSAAQEVAARIVDVSQEAESTGKLALDISKISVSVAESVEDLKTVLIRVVRTSTKEVERRRKPRFEIHRDARVSSSGNRYEMTVENCSEGGALLKGGESTLRARDRITIEILDLPAISGHVLSVTKAGVHVKFDDEPQALTAFAARLRHITNGTPALIQAA